MRLNRRFSLITLLAVLTILSTLALGRWQLSRAAEKVSLQRSLDDQAAMPRLDNSTLVPGVKPASVLHRNVTLRGHWLARRTVYLDNRQMNSKPGLYVVTPLQLTDSSVVLIVQRGWVARNFLDRTQVPEVETTTDEVEIQGRIVPPPAKLFELGTQETGRIRQNLDLAHYSAELGLPLLPLSVQQAGPATEGLLREWPVASTGVEKHYGYAFQWFALSALIAILYVWFQIVRRFIHPKRG